MSAEDDRFLMDVVDSLSKMRQSLGPQQRVVLDSLLGIVPEDEVSAHSMANSRIQGRVQLRISQFGTEQIEAYQIQK
ncbi:MAG TPA: hypothetical protein VF813_09985 [Anaerolineaceae bacterium]